MVLKVQSYTDEELLRGLAGTRDMDNCIRYLYQEHFGLLSHYIINNNGKQEDAEDIFQEVVISFINLVQAGKFRGESSIKTFLFSLNKNLWLNELKRQGRAQVREQKYSLKEEKEDVGAAVSLEYRESMKHLSLTMDTLGETCKQILLLFYFEEKSMKEITNVLPYENEQVVRNKKHKCLKKLEEMIHGNQTLYKQLKTFLHG